MATFLQGATDFFPPEKLFTPNWGLIQQGLMLKQSRYDKGFAQLSSTARAVIDSPLLNEYSKERRKQILADAEQALKDLPNMDLSLPQNVAMASSLFRPFYEDNHILHDMVQTKQYMSQRQLGVDLSKAEKDEERNRYWSMGIEDLDNWADDFSKASPEEMMKMRSRRYVSKPNIDDQILKMFNDGKLKRVYDELDGQYKYTYENGEPVKVPLVNLYLSMAENDPEAMEGFNVMGRVTRSRFIRENTANGKFGSTEEAAKAHDNALANDYFNTQKGVLEGTEDAMQKLQIQLDNWKKRADAGTLVAGSEDEQKAISDQKEYNSLKLRAEKIRGDIFDIAGKPAPYLSRITNNPTAHLAQTYLNKMAIDLATSLSQFGSRKVETNPVYKDLVLPFKLEDYKYQKQIQLEQFKTEEEIRKQRGLYDLKIEYGIPLYDADDNTSSGTGAGGTRTPKAPLGPGGLNVPTVLEDEKASAANALPRDDKNQVNTYQLFNEVNDDLRNRLIASKVSFIEMVLDPSEIKDLNGNLIPPNKRSELISMSSTFQRFTRPNVQLSPSDPQYNFLGSNVLKKGFLESQEDFDRRKMEYQIFGPKQSRFDKYNVGNNIFEGVGQFNPRLETGIRKTYSNELDRLYDLALTRYKSWGETGTNNAKYQQAVKDLARINNINDVWTAAIQFKSEKLREVVNNLNGSNPDNAYIYNALFDSGGISSLGTFISKLKLDPTFKNNAIAIASKSSEMRNLQSQIDVEQRWIGKYGDPNGEHTGKIRALRAQMTDPTLVVEKAAEELGKQYETFKNDIITTWNKAGNEFNYFAEGQKGGGVFNRKLIFYGMSTVKGEDADRYTESLIQTISPYASEKGGGYSDTNVKFDFNDGAQVNNNSDAESLFQLITPSLLNTVKVGGKDNITQHQFKTSQIAGNDANWAAYTINVDPKWIQENTSTSETAKLLTKPQAANLLKGLTVYVKKAERDDNGNFIRVLDNSLAALETGRIGEVDMLLRANNGLFTREIAPGFKITVSGLSTGGYKIVTNYVKKEAKSDGTIFSTDAQDSRELDPSLDLTNAYYSVLNSIMSMIYNNEDITKRVESSRLPNPQVQKVNWNDIQNAAKQ